jgi:hypothetical protein
MASKLVTLNDAAVQLGITPEKLNELRQSGQIYGYRDGASWKFKHDDVERLREEMAFGGAEKQEENEFDFLGGFGAETETAAEQEFDLKLTSDEDVLLTTDPQAGPDEPGPSSTVVGKDKPQSAVEEFTFGGDDEEIELSFGDEPEAPSKPAGAPKAPSAGLSDILAGAIDTGPGASGVLSDFGADDLGASDLGLAAGSSNVLGGTSDVHDEVHVLLNPSESELGLEDTESQTVVKKAGSSSVKLGDDDIFGGPAGSDVTLRPSDSGILLIDPGDSGLSLEAPPEIGGSAVNLGGSNLNLGDDATTDFDFGDSAEMKTDDDFLLTPLEEVGEDDSDSGSQVIMLDTEDSEAGGFGEATATLLAGDIPGLGGMLEEESPLGGFGGPSLGAGGYAGGGVATAGAPASMMVPMVREVPFPGWLVGLLGLCTITLGLGGAMMFDLMMNIWSWDGPYPFNSTIMDLLAGR